MPRITSGRRPRIDLQRSAAPFHPRLLTSPEHRKVLLSWGAVVKREIPARSLGRIEVDGSVTKLAPGAMDTSAGGPSGALDQEVTGLGGEMHGLGVAFVGFSIVTGEFTDPPRSFDG